MPRLGRSYIVQHQRCTAPAVRAAGQRTVRSERTGQSSWNRGSRHHGFGDDQTPGRCAVSTSTGFDVWPTRSLSSRLWAGRSTVGAEVAAASELVIFSLPTIPSLEAATEDVAAGAHPGLIAAEMGVFPIESKQASFDRLAEVGVELMDVPVSGTGLQAADGTLGGDGLRVAGSL